MLADLLLPPIPALLLTRIDSTPDTLTLALTATQATTPCPLCSVAATRIHSTYSRAPADLPCTYLRLRLVLAVRRWFCDNPACPRILFCERLGPALPVYARLTGHLQLRGLRVGSKPGAAFGALVGFPTSPTTLLRLVRQAPLPDLPTPRVLGVDDFAFRKGQTYGTILIDLERHHRVDLLPDREPATVIAWLHAHPGVEIISRDRASAYAAAATEGAPAAVQVADRFHLVVNLSDAVQRLWDRFPGALQQGTEHLAPQASQSLAPLAPPQTSVPSAAAPAAPKLSPPPGPAALAEPPLVGGAHSAPPTPGTARTAQRFAAVKALQAQGLGQRAIATRLGWHRRTVRRYMVADQVPARGAGRQAQSQVRMYVPYLRRRWAAGCHNRTQLWQELHEQGYCGSYTSVYRALIRLFGVGRTPTGAGARAGGSAVGPRGEPDAPGEVRPLTARQARWLILRRPEELTAEETVQRGELLTACPTVVQTEPLVQRFLRMVRERQGAELDGWVADALSSGVAELRNFAIGLKRDYAAVQAGLTLPWSHERAAYCTPSPRSSRSGPLHFGRRCHLVGHLAGRRNTQLPRSL